jgi:hypothetical protein
MKYWYDKDFKGIVCEPNCADEWLWHIWAIGVDYDGCHNVEDLKGLVDELVDMANKARECLYGGKLFDDKEESARSYEDARLELDKYDNTKLI